MQPEARPAEPDRPRPPGVEPGGTAPDVAAQTDNSRTAAVARSLAELDSVPLADHPDVYQRLHAELQSGLAGIDGT